MFQEVYFGSCILDKEYELSGIKDYDGYLHASFTEVTNTVKSSYKYQVAIDVNGDGKSEAIFINKESGRWVTAEIDTLTGEIDYSDHVKEVQLEL